MSYPINYPTPQGANVQIFQGSSTRGGTEHTNTRRWVKPQGASFVWFTLIGAGGGGGVVSGGSYGGGGGSGAVTNFMCPAFLIPDDLQVVIGEGYANTGGTTKIVYQQKDGTGYDLLTADGGAAGGTDTIGTGGAAMSANYFTAIGFLNSVAGQDGSASDSSASTTTFLSGGPSNTGSVTGNYGYSVAQTKRGFFMTQPIIVGVANGGNAGSSSAISTATGCGGSGANDNSGFVQSYGGNGMVVIITW
jgi:hypothetical protein